LRERVDGTPVVSPLTVPAQQRSAQH
jgi:hypothetical protein